MREKKWILKVEKKRMMILRTNIYNVLVIHACKHIHEQYTAVYA